MIERIDDQSERRSGGDDDLDERVGEAVESFLALAERGQAPGVDEFIARYPDLRDDVRAALDGLELVHGLLGLGSATGSGSGRGVGGDHGIESGRRIAGYRVVRELGRGGMGTVFEAVHVGLDRPVALKVLGTHAAPDSSARRRFLNEARTAAGLHHTHIVPVFDVGQVGGLCYYAMQRIEGSGLDRVLRHLRRGRLLAGPDRSGSPWSATPDGPGGSETSSANSRLGRLWLRVSTPWRRRPAPAQARNGWSDHLAARSALPSVSPAGPTDRAGPQIGLNDSTVSWVGGGRRASRPPGPSIAPEPVAAPMAMGLAAIPAIETDQRGHDDEPPPYAPPRGSAYFRWVAGVGVQAASALAHAHRLGVIHRDVKPSNLLIDGKGNIWVTDFGLARRLADPGLTHHDSLLGTPRYMSPEQARTGAIDGRTDVYSLGATLYELLTLRPPFDGRSAAELVEQIGQDEPMPPSAIDRRVPRDVETIVLKALAKRPADRYATAAELAEDLERFLNREPVRARRISPPGRLWRVACRHPRVTAFTTSAAAVIVAIATFAYVRVLADRDNARQARDQTEKALQFAELASRDEKLERSKNETLMRQAMVNAVAVVALSGAPNRRSQGLELIRTVDLGPEPELRPKLRDEAVKFLVLREVKPQERELRTGPARGIVFGPAGHRLAVLSDDDETLAFWDVGRRARQNVVSLRALAGTGPAASDPAPSENVAGPGSEPAATGIPAAVAGRNASAVASRRDPGWFVSQRVAQCGQLVATILPEYKGVALVDLVPGGPARTLTPPDRAVLGVLGDPGGKRLVTIEQLIDDELSAAESLAAGDGFSNSYEVRLWDPERLDHPVAKLTWGGGSQPGRPGGPLVPLVAISPDGNTVAVATFRDKFVSLFSALDGRPLGRAQGRRGGGQAGRSEGRDEGRFDTQTGLTALTFGPNDSLATAGVTRAGTVIKIWDLVDPRTLPIIFAPNQTSTRLMRYSPQGTLLAIVGANPIELWDPLAHNLVAVLQTNDQTADLAFAPDGRTLAAAGRSGETAVWTVYNSTVRTQLSGFESPPWSLGFNEQGVLAGAGMRGDLWFWRSGRCPEVGPPAPPAVASTASAKVPDSQNKPFVPPPHEGVVKTDPAPRDGRRPRAGERGPAPVALAFDAKGRLVAHDTRSLRIWPAGSSSPQAPPLFTRAWLDTAGRPFPSPMAKTADGRIMVFARPGSLFLWDAEAADTVVPITLPPGWEPMAPAAATKTGHSPGTPVAEPPRALFRELQIAPGGDRLYWLEFKLGQVNAIHVWPIERRSPSEAVARDLNWSVSLTDGAVSIALRGDGELLAVGDRTGKVTLVDTLRRTIIARIPPASGDSENYRLALAFSPDGQNLAVGSPEGTISLWSLSQPGQPRLRYHLPGHRGTTTILAFDHQGRRIASAAGTDSLVEVWDLDQIDRELGRLRLAD